MTDLPDWYTDDVRKVAQQLAVATGKPESEMFWQFERMKERAETTRLRDFCKVIYASDGELARRAAANGTSVEYEWAAEVLETSRGAMNG